MALTVGVGTVVDAREVVVIITGAAGDKESDTVYDKPFPSYTGSTNYGYGLYTAVDKNTATWTFHTVQADPSGGADFSDTLTIKKGV